MSNHAYFQKPAEEEQEKKVLESRYNLRRRKDDGDAKPAEQTEDKEAEQKPAAATAPITTELEFGGRLGERRNREMWLLSLSQLVMCWIESVGWGRMVLVCKLLCQSNCTRMLVCTLFDKNAFREGQ